MLLLQILLMLPPHLQFLLQGRAPCDGRGGRLGPFTCAQQLFPGAIGSRLRRRDALLQKDQSMCVAPACAHAGTAAQPRQKLRRCPRAGRGPVASIDGAILVMLTYISHPSIFGILKCANLEDTSARHADLLVMLHSLFCRHIDGAT
jgi:hypothetical protein